MTQIPQEIVLASLGRLPVCGCGHSLQASKKHTLVTKVVIRDAVFGFSSDKPKARQEVSVFKEEFVQVMSSQVPSISSSSSSSSRLPPVARMVSAILSITLYCRACAWLIPVKIRLHERDGDVRDRIRAFETFVQPFDGL